MERGAGAARPEVLQVERSLTGTGERVNVGRVGSFFVGGHFPDQCLHVEDASALLVTTFARVFPSGTQERGTVRKWRKMSRRAWKLFGLVPLMDVDAQAKRNRSCWQKRIVSLSGRIRQGTLERPRDRCSSELSTSCTPTSRKKRDGGASSARQGSASQSAQWASFEGATGIDRGESSSQERGDAAGVACEETSGAIEGDSTGSHAVRPRRRDEVGRQVVRDLSEVCAFRIVSRSRRVHQ